jgi:hypothetical protein
MCAPYGNGKGEMRRNEKNRSRWEQQDKSDFSNKKGKLALTPLLDYILTFTMFSGSKPAALFS